MTHSPKGRERERKRKRKRNEAGVPESDVLRHKRSTAARSENAVLHVRVDASFLELLEHLADRLDRLFKVACGLGVLKLFSSLHSNFLLIFGKL